MYLVRATLDKLLMKSKTILKREKLTAVLRGRCDPKLKSELVKFSLGTPFREAHWVRTAVQEFMARRCDSKTTRAN